jgi:hypothetical protein
MDIWICSWTRCRYLRVKGSRLQVSWDVRFGESLEIDQQEWVMTARPPEMPVGIALAVDEEAAMGRQTIGRQPGWQHPRCRRSAVVKGSSVTGGWRSRRSRC